MKTITLSIRSMLILMLVAVVKGTACSDEVILRVDCNAGMTGEQVDWKQFGWPTGNVAGPASVTYTGLDPDWTSSGVPRQATITFASGASITSTNNLTARDRGAPEEGATGFTYSNVYRDFITPCVNESLWIGLSGLTPDTAYDLTLYSYDNNNTLKMVFVDYTGGTPGTSDAANFTAATIFDSNTSSDIYAGTVAMLSDSSGNLLVRVLPTNPVKAGLISGLSLAKGVAPKALSLKVDFGMNLTQVQDGFSPFMVPSGDTVGPVVASFGGLTTKGSTGTVVVTLAAGTNLTDTSKMLSRDRATPASDVGAFTYSAVYRDLIIAKVKNESFWVGLSGLTPGARYSLTFYAYDNSNTRTMTFTDFTKGFAGVSGAVSYTAGSTFDDSTPNDVLSVSLATRADENGSILIRDMPSSGGTAIINALHLELLPDQGTLFSIR